MWESIKYVGGIFSLIAFVSACILAGFRIKINQTKNLITVAKEEERAKLIDKTLEFFNVDVNTLSDKDKYNIVMRQIKEKSKRQFRVIFATIILSIVAASIAFLINSQSKSTNVTLTNEPKLVNDTPTSILITTAPVMTSNEEKENLENTNFSHIGKYYNTINEIHYIELKEDNTFLLYENFVFQTGFYEIKSNELILRDIYGNIVIRTINKNTIIDPSGIEWIKE